MNSWFFVFAVSLWVIANLCVAPGSLADVQDDERQVERLLNVAAQDGDLPLAKEIIEIGVDVDASDAGGWTPLMHAAVAGHADVVAFLLEAGADPSAKTDEGVTPLHTATLATKTDSSEVITSLVDAGADVNAKDAAGVTPLIAATADQRLSNVSALLDSGADANTESKAGSTPLLLAVQSDNLEIIKLLLSNGADASKRNSNGATAADVAKAAGNKPAAEFLSRLAGPSSQIPVEHLIQAILENDRAKLYQAIDLGADPNEAYGSAGWTPLMFAVHGGNRHLVYLLVEHAGADVNARNEKGVTALHIAALMGNFDEARYLEKAGAVMSAPLPDGTTADDIIEGASEKPFAVDPDIVKLVQEALGADGYEPGPADGKLGPKTRDAIVEYQGDWQIPTTGKITRDLVWRLQFKHAARDMRWQKATNQDCMVLIPNPFARESVSFDGTCVDGKMGDQGTRVRRYTHRGRSATETVSGSFKYGRLHGQGSREYSHDNVDAKKTTGQHSIGLVHGHAVTSYWNGEEYEGQFKNDMYHGEGRNTWSGNQYEGQFRDGHKHGVGRYTGVEGSRYEGEWKDDLPHGDGKYTWSDGRQYEGQLLKGRQHGHGVSTWKNGARYEGQFKDGLKHGEGRYTQADGSKYDGQWKDGLPHGVGKAIDFNGTRCDGSWKRGRPVGRHCPYDFSEGLE